MGAATIPNYLVSFFEAPGRSHEDAQQSAQATAEHLERLEFADGACIIREGDPGDSMFWVEAGRVCVVRESTQQQVATLSRGDFFGELSLLSGEPRAATVRADGAVTLYRLTKDQFLALSQVFPQMSGMLFGKLYNRLSASHVELQKANRLRMELGSVFTQVVLVVCIYTFVIAFVHSEAMTSPSFKFVASRLTEVGSLVVIYRLLTMSSVPRSSFGLTLAGWKRAALESVPISLAVMALLAGIKWAGMRWGWDPVGDGTVISLRYVDWTYYTYLVVAPLQEFISRGVIQGSMQRLLTGKNPALWAICITSFLFGALHLHSSLSLGFSALISSLFWGWMFSRHGNLVGVSISHFLIGNWTGLLGLWTIF